MTTFAFGSSPQPAFHLLAESVNFEKYPELKSTEIFLTTAIFAVGIALVAVSWQRAEARMPQPSGSKFGSSSAMASLKKPAGPGPSFGRGGGGGGTITIRKPGGAAPAPAARKAPSGSGGGGLFGALRLGGEGDGLGKKKGGSESQGGGKPKVKAPVSSVASKAKAVALPGLGGVFGGKKKESPGPQGGTAGRPRR